MGLEVIGAGFGRTGTMSSLKVALEELGFGPCYHMSEVFENPGHVEQWEAAREGRAYWEKLFRGYRATVDWPRTAYNEELMQRYHDAKVILTVRDSLSSTTPRRSARCSGAAGLSPPRLLSAERRS